MKKLCDESDIDLIKKIKNNNCSDSLKILVERHNGICFSISKKYLNSPALNIHDIEQNKHWIVYNSVMSFDENKGSKFSTWLANQVRFYCLNTKNKSDKLTLTEDSVLEFLINKNIQDNRLQKEMLENIIDLFNQISDPNTKDAIYYRYFHNKDRILNYAEIADILKVTPQTVLNWHNKFIDFAKKKLTKNTNAANI